MSKIQDIHDSYLYGIVVETGASCAISSRLMNIAGANKTIYFAKQPYSKEYEESCYGKFPRSVSKEFIESVLTIEGKEDKANFVLASSWQLCNPKDPLQYAHGWIGLFDRINNVKHYLHFSFRRDLVYAYNNFENPSDKRNNADRRFLIDQIGQLGINILHTAINGNILELDQLTGSSMVALDMAYINNDVNYDLLLSTLEKADGDYLLVFDNNKPIRIEDLMRKGDSFILLRGSFNPPHPGHLSLLKYSVESHINSISTFLISTNRYDKPHISINEVKERIININKLNYPLIICKNQYFYGVFDLLNKWSYNKKFFYPIGCDTINRILKTDIEENNDIKSMVDMYKNNHKFIFFEREGYNRNEATSVYNEMLEINNLYMDEGFSSTKIREKLL